MARLHGTTSLRAQRNPPIVTIFGTTPALAPLCQGAAGGLPVPGEARQVARGATAEPGCTFKGPVAAGARLHSCSGAAAVPTRRARQPARQPARPPRPGPPLAPREQSPRPPPPPNFRGGQRPRGRCGLSAGDSPLARAAPLRDPRSAGSSPQRRGTAKASAPRPGAGRGADKAQRRRRRQGRTPRPADAGR